MNKFEWLRMVASSAGPKSTTTRYCLLTLSLYMDKNGGNCFPSTKTLSEATGLSERVVCKHLRIASGDGWVVVSTRGKSGQGWKRHQYSPAIPGNVLTEGQRLERKGTDPGSVPSARRTDLGAKGTDPGTRRHLPRVSRPVITSQDTSQNNNARSFLLKDDSSFYIDTEFYEILKTSYPTIDIDDELKKLTAWCYANPRKRKTRTGAKRFVNNWMNNAKQKPAGQSNFQQMEFDFVNQIRETA